MDNYKIGEFIATQRKTKGLNQRQLADKLQVTDKAVSRWETGKGMPETSLLQPLAKELGITVSELLNGERIDNSTMNYEADRLIVNTLTKSKKKTKISIALSLIIVILIGLVGFLCTNYQNKEPIRNIDTTICDVQDENGASCFGIAFDIDASKRVDGYEFKAYMQENIGTSYVESKNEYSSNIDKYYFCAQDGPKMLRIRAYTENDGNKEYSKWYTVYSFDDVDLDNMPKLTGEEWSNSITDFSEFDPYNM